MDCGKCLCANIYFKQWGVRHCRVSQEMEYWGTCTLGDRDTSGVFAGGVQDPCGAPVFRLGMGRLSSGSKTMDTPILNRCVIINSHQ